MNDDNKQPDERKSEKYCRLVGQRYGWVGAGPGWGQSINEILIALLEFVHHKSPQKHRPQNEHESTHA